MDPYESEYQRLHSIRSYLYQPVNPQFNALPYCKLGHLQVTSGHADHCQFRLQGKTMPCSCCHGSLTFSAANNFIETLFIQPAEHLQTKVVSSIQKIPQSAGIGLANIVRRAGRGLAAVERAEGSSQYMAFENIKPCLSRQTIVWFSGLGRASAPVWRPWWTRVRVGEP